MRRLITILLAAIFVALATYSIYTVIQFNKGNEEPGNIVTHNHPLNNKQIGDIAVTDMNGQKKEIASLLKHDITIINVWASWCEPCKKEMPELVTYGKEKPNHVGLIGFNVQDKIEKRDAFIDNYKPTYPMYTLDEASMKRYKIYNIPTTVFVDKQGKVLKTYVGELNQQKIEEIIMQIQ
ncbi:TlpA family protein disulfide reductase [Macrococcus psychrotolerans]|uniref:TlpA disulfide reductase family protein n=1 Tax=Macrococcus psychrotolerans TaxID=3039389 RepID=A0AAU6RGN6_9STAP|nr:MULTISPECIES: TlpA disulfide reductase family protein [Macrococcus]QYA33363.1 TlpA family protein disulfide reductase [Macrococcus sp. 19Msa1099]QYA38178.1 TlpA family protein disulfide reductase [Macrococcus caseolyticus]QYA76885.1 TlpA family protein disulfide reductase [Macrococcus caseolyticus]